MTPECKELEVLRSLHAAGALDAGESARVAAHLEACAECREADRLDRELLGLVRLPEPTPAEALAVADLTGRTLRELKRRERRLTWLRRLGTGTGIAAVAAAVLMMLLWPAVARHPVPPAAAAGQQTAVVAAADDASASWEEDDLDTEDGSTATASSISDVALAAYDAGVGE